MSSPPVVDIVDDEAADVGVAFAKNDCNGHFEDYHVVSHMILLTTQAK